MLENLNLKRKLGRKECNGLLPGLQRRLYDLEKACWDHKIASIVVFEGWDAAGKGSAISTLTQRLDPRGFKVYATQAPRTLELGFPWLWRFWLKVPNRGEMVIFDQSWYGRVLDERVEKRIPESEWQAAYRDINDFERVLTDDGAVILKFFLHISEKEQRKRFKTIEADPLEAWRVSKKDWARHRKYGQYLAAVEEMLELTEAGAAPWTLIEATSRGWARKKILDGIIAGLEARLGRQAPPRQTSEETDERDVGLRAAMDSLDRAEDGAR
jgi:AMP-polyphosphate phosphotransferase